MDTKSILEEIEQPTVKVNTLLLWIAEALDRGDTEKVRNLLAEAEEANWTNRRALLEAGVRDSIRGDRPAPPDDEDLIDTGSLDLGDLRREFQSPE